MCNLLAEGFRRLFKSKRFYIVLICVVGIPAAITIFASIIKNDAKGVADLMLFFMTGSMTMFISITSGLFIIHDFKNNTIRNKIIIGHSRTNIYFANLIVSLFVALVYQVAYWLTLVGFGKVLDEFEFFPCTEIFKNMLLTIFIVFAFTSAFVFLCTTMRNNGGFAICLMLDTIVTTVVSLVLMFLKSETAEDIAVVAIPSVQRNLFRADPIIVPDDMGLMILVDIGICVVTTIAGIAVFKKADLK